ncbi:MAG TPA: hypothetical protein VKM94_26245 [Blastocatellia bacterium]|nr:hypothetical protein [Blastocatellia bacterium]
MGDRCVQGYYHLYQGWRMAFASTAMFFVWSVYFVFARRAYPIVLAHLYLDALAFQSLRKAGTAIGVF